MKKAHFFVLVNDAIITTSARCLQTYTDVSVRLQRSHKRWERHEWVTTTVERENVRRTPRSATGVFSPENNVLETCI